MLICFCSLLLVAAWIQLNNRCCEFFQLPVIFVLFCFSYKTDFFPFKQLLGDFQYGKLKPSPQQRNSDLLLIQIRKKEERAFLSRHKVKKGHNLGCKINLQTVSQAKPIAINRPNMTKQIWLIHLSNFFMEAICFVFFHSSPPAPPLTIMMIPQYCIKQVYANIQWNNLVSR